MIGLLALAAAPALAGAGTISVGGGCSLADAIRSANADMNLGGCTGAGGDETLVLDEDVVLSSADATSSLLFDTRAGLPDIASSMTIEAGTASRIERDASLACERGDIGPRFRLLNVTGGAEVTLRGLTLANGCAFGGGAVAVAHGGSSNVTFDGVTWSGNTALGAFDSTAHPDGVEARGGALAIDALAGGTVTAVGSTFDGNQALGGDVCPNRSARGGAIDLAAGADAEVVVRGSTFNANRVEVGRCVSTVEVLGGALATSSSAALKVEGSDFVGNSATGFWYTATSRGGAVYAGAETSVEIVSSSIRDSSAVGGGAIDGGDGPSGHGIGGGLYLVGSVEIVDSVIEGNVARGGFGNDIDVGGRGVGGGLRLIDGTLRNVLVRDNLASGGEAWFLASRGLGGGLYATGSVEAFGLVLFDNEARGETGGSGVGGGAYFAGASATLRTVSSTISGNRARGVAGPNESGSGLGGGIAVSSDATLRLEATTVTRNRAIAGGEPVSSGGPPGDAAGGGLRLQSSAEVLGSIVFGNLLVDGNGAETDGDCQGSVQSLGANLVSVPASCSFDAAGDQVGVDPLLGALGDYGCAVELPGGECVPSHPLDPASPALDRGSCPPDATTDARGFGRPWDLPLIADFADACDVGSFEIIDSNGDGQDDVVEMVPIFDDGFESGDTSGWS